MINQILSNDIFVAGALAWAVGQFLKFPVDFLLNKRWDWTIMFSSGGLPSSHSSLVTAVTIMIGLVDGFSTSIFALSAAIALIVIYDAAGVRRQAGIHAERINKIMKDIFESRQFPEEELKEVLGHTPFEVISGIALGVIISILVYANV